jgi:hypothetical protein
MRKEMKLTKLTITAAILSLAIVLTFGTFRCAGAASHNYKPVEGYVPNEETAIAIAVAVWVPIYGKERIEEKKPYKAILKDGIWYVRGSIPQGWTGGVPEAEISKDNGQILRVSHGK